MALSLSVCLPVSLPADAFALPTGSYTLSKKNRTILDNEAAAALSLGGESGRQP